MALRVASAAVGLPLLSALVWLGPPWFSLLLAALAALGALEICRMALPRGGRPMVPLAMLWAVTLVAGGHLVATGSAVWIVLAAVAGVWAASAAAWGLARWRDADRASDWGITAAAALLTGGFLSYGPLLRELAQGRDWVFLLLMVTFATDTGALFVGRGVGRRPLAPTVSPGKTWEGAIGGLVTAIAACVALASALDLDMSPALAAVLGALMGVAGQAGDLAESRLKRTAGVKDSGWLIPGHGGVLDRMDSIVLNLVLVYYFVIWAVQ